MTLAKIKQILKMVAVNLVTFIILLLVTNWLCGLYLKKTKSIGREGLPNYKADTKYAQAIFKDYNSLKHQYEPFVGWKVLPYQGSTTHVNEQGFRIHTNTTPVSKDSSRTVAFFGGSTMWGEGSDDQHTIPALFNAENLNYTVSNFGQLAYNSRQELDGLINLYSKNNKPDIVIFYDGVNDAAFLCPSEITELPSHRLVPLFRSKLYIERSSFVKEVFIKTFLENIIKLINRNPKKEESASLYNCLGESGKAEEIATIMIKNWEIAHEIVSARGGKFIAILQPAAYVEKPKLNHLILDEELGKNFKEVYRLMKEKIKEKNYDWIYDMTNSFDKDEYIYIDFCHVSSNGNEIIARRITEILK